MTNRYPDIFNNAEDIVANDLRNWFLENSVDASIVASSYVNMMDDGTMTIVREFNERQQQLPYIVINIANPGEMILSWGGNSIGATSSIILTLVGPTYNVIGENLVVKDLKTNKIYTLRFPNVLFNDATIVPINQMLNVLRFQMPSNWSASITGDNIEIKIVNTNIEVLNGAFGITPGIKTADFYMNRQIMVSATLHFDMGCESKRVRSDLEGLLLIYIEKIRETKGIISDGNVTVILSSPFKSSNSVYVMGSDNLNRWYLSNFSGTIMIEATNIEGSGQLLMPVTAIEPLMI